MDNKKLLKAIEEYKALGIDDQIDYHKFYLYSLITHSTAIEGSTVTEVENRLLFDEGIPVKGRSMAEQLMNLDLKAAYETTIQLAQEHSDFDIELLKRLSALVMKNTGSKYNTVLGNFDSGKGDLRLLNVTAGVGGESYLAFQKVPSRLKDFCEWLNIQRKSIDKLDVVAIYRLSFDAHYYLVMIHPWADGNGRMSRLVMNYIQFEFGLIPSKVSKDNKAAYIQALQGAREKDDLRIFSDYMTAEHISNLKAEISSFKKSLDSDVVINKKNVVINVVITEQERHVLDLLKKEPLLTSANVSDRLKMSERQVQRIFASLKEKKLLHRNGSNKNGSWKVEKFANLSKIAKNVR